MRKFDRYMGGIPEETGYERDTYCKYIQNIKTREKYECDLVYVSKDNRYIILINDNYLDKKNYRKQGILEISSGNYTKQIYDYIGDEFYNYFIVSKGGKKGILDEHLKLAIPIIYDEIYRVRDEYFHDNYRYPLCIVKKGDSRGLMDYKTGRAIIPCSSEVTNIELFSEDIVQVTKNGKIGLYKDCINVLPPVYEMIRHREDGCYDVIIGRYYGLINQEFKEVAPCIYDEPVGKFLKYGYALVKKEGYYGLIDGHDEIISCKYEKIEPFGEDGLSIAKQNGKWGIIDIYDKEIVPFEYDKILPFNNEGLAQVKKGEKNGFINYEYKEVVPCIYDTINPFGSNNLAQVKREGKLGCINRAYKEVIPCIYYFIQFIGYNYACVKGENLKFGIVNLHGKEIVPCIYDKEISHYNNGGFVVKRNGKYGFIDCNGTEIVDCIWEENNKGYHNEGYQISKVDKNLVVLDNKNRIVFQSKKNTLESLFSVISSEIVEYNKDGNPQITSYCRRYSKCFITRDNNLFFGRLRDPVFSSKRVNVYLEINTDGNNYNTILRVTISDKNEKLISTEGDISFVSQNNTSISFKFIGGKITYSPLSHRYISTAKIPVPEEDLLKILSQDSKGYIHYNEENEYVVAKSGPDSFLFLKYLICPNMCSEAQSTYLKSLVEIEIREEKSSLKEYAQEDKEARDEYERTLSLRNVHLEIIKNKPRQSDEYRRKVAENREKRKEEADLKAAEIEANRKEEETRKKLKEEELRVQHRKEIHSQKAHLEKLLQEYRYKLFFPFGRLVRWVIWFVLLFISLGESPWLFVLSITIYPIFCFLYFFNREHRDNDYKDAIKSIKKELKDLERKENDIS